ncbi:aspartate kinase [Vibrio sp. SCSIO 43140]|uniref:aspartate kinase n=1 Tax=Vibrio TaxID=662 RepID=UPI002074EA01|nr:aspartate kinase [Vibrio sp. SCSIO 43140]USD60131.1 aspartate kinase [Vibrio sp. SCSIO 43140]
MKRPLIVQKFGGTSVGSVERIHSVAEHVIRAKQTGNQVVVVVSAMSGETNRLVELAKQVDKVPNVRELDVLLSAGEQISMALLSMTLSKLGHAAISLTGGQARIMTNNNHNNATISHIDTSVIDEHLAQDKIVIVAGFQGINEVGDITTLGRGGSDTTAVTLAGALNAQECQIFTDVDGVYSCDPRVVKNAQKLDSIDFPTMHEMAHKGAKVLHLPCVAYAWQNHVPLRVLSSFDAGEGTLVAGKEAKPGICGLAIQKQVVSLRICEEHVDVVDKQKQMLGVEESHWVTDSTYSHLLVKTDCRDKLKLVIEDKIVTEQDVSLLTLVGSNAAEQASQYQQLLNLSDISVLHFCEDTHSITLVLEPGAIDKAANVLHDNYIIASGSVEREEKQVHLG